MRRHFTNFNSRETLAAAEAYVAHLDAGGKMMVTLSGAMSTAGIGRTLARMIRRGKVHAITCTGANLEEDIFLLLAGNEYETVPHWRALSADDEQALYDRGMNRVTDTCIPEDVMRHVEDRLHALYAKALDGGTRRFPYEYYYDVLRQDDLKQHYQMPAEDSWMLAAMEADLPIFTPGWEDSTQGNMFTAWAMKRNLENHGDVVKLGTEAMVKLANWYRANCGVAPSSKAADSHPSAESAATAADGLTSAATSDTRGSTSGGLASGGPSVGFFQVGGGIAGDFPICVVPMMIQDLGWEDTPFWGYFCQVCDAPTSYGGYSGAVPNEKITWGKLTPTTPSFMVQSDATIVVPLVFAYVLGD